MSHHDPRPHADGSRWHADRSAIAWLPTLLAKGPRALHRDHLRHGPRPARPKRLHLILLDTSGSMRRGGRLALAKGHAAWLIEQAARDGDDAALLVFGGHGVALTLPPRPARAATVARVRPLGGGGGTPLSQALIEAGRLLRRRRSTESCLWLLTDGRSLEQPAAPDAGQVVIVDFDDPSRAIGRCADWASRWGATHRIAGTHRAPRPE